MFCECGCGKTLFVQRKDRIPRYKRGHNPIKFHGKKHSVLARERLSKRQYREKHWNWKGGKKISEHGYVRALVSSNPHIYKFEHRLVMESHLGRKLEKHEDTHHINGNKQDNRIENLQLITHGEHSHLHHEKEKKKG